MADLDSGHIFLTTMAPILPGAPEDAPQVSYEQRVRVALATLPPAHQSPATVATEYGSPFARNTRNHLTRMFVLSDLTYNGRVNQNALVAQIKGDKPIVPQKVDALKTPYLVFCAEVDAVVQDGDPLPTNLSDRQQKEVRASYAKKLWETMGEELSAIYSNCYGFEGVKTGDDFAAYLDKCHIETTMPFHDYYLELPKFHNLPTTALLFGVAAPFVVGLLALVLWLFGLSDMPILGWSTFGTFLGGILLGLLIAVLAYKYTLWNGSKPLAPATYDDLPSVLKALYVQQNFSEFFIDSQGLPPEELHAKFGAFVETHNPQNRQSMTQKPGVISSADPANVTP